jgi:hypothetical protein
MSESEEFRLVIDETTGLLGRFQIPSATKEET